MDCYRSCCCGYAETRFAYNAAVASAIARFGCGICPLHAVAITLTDRTQLKQTDARVSVMGPSGVRALS